MKKQYITPALDILSLELKEIIVTSIRVADGSSNGSQQYSRHRDPIWNDDE